MKPSNVIQSLKFLVGIQRPAFLWGPPGIGKSDMVAQVAADLKMELRDVRMSLLDPVDLKGFPVPSKIGAKQVMSWLPPDFLPTKGKGILFLDEFNGAPSAVQSAGYQLILNRRIGEYELPPGWSVVAAGNRASDRSVTHAQPAAMANRFIHIECEADAGDWNTWAGKNKISDETRGYIRWRPNNLTVAKIEAGVRGFPSPRTWAFADQVINSGLPPEVELDLLRGTVGDGHALEYVGFVREAKTLGNIESYILNPAKAKVPESPSTCYALVSALESRVSPSNFPRVMEFMGRMEKEFEVMFVGAALKKNDEIATTKTFITWTEKNSDVLFG